MSLLLTSPPGAPLRKFPFVGRGAFPFSMAAIAGLCVSVSGAVKDVAMRLRVEDEDVVRDSWMIYEGWEEG